VTDSHDINSQPLNNGPTEEELQAAKKVVASLQLVRKNYSLYPEGHTVCSNSLEQFHSQLKKYLTNFGNLRLDIERDQLLSQGETILSEPPEEGTLAFTLFRDGIRWLEFTEGIKADEIKEFLRIINKYSILSDEPEGDIVTAFWENRLPHIKYEVSDFFWGVEQDVELAPPQETENTVSALLRESKLADWKPLADPPILKEDILVAPEEAITIQEMVCIEEDGDPTAYLDALLDSLLQHREQENFKVILEVLEEEFVNSLARRDFDISIKILQSLKYVVSSCTDEIPWTGPVIEDFFLTVSSSPSLNPLQDVWPEIEPDQIEKLRQIILLLQPEAVHTLGTLLSKNQPVKMRQMLVEVISSLSVRDFRPLEALLKNPDEKLMEKLVHVIINLGGERSSRILMKLIRHKSTYVRQEAVKGLLQKGPDHIKDVFSLINDRDESIRRLILKQLGQSRSPVAESLLLDYLEQGKYTNADSEHIVACFTTLGQCGSSSSIPFLKNTLFNMGRMPSFSVSPQRKGAAVALSKLASKEAQQVLEEARRSLNPVVRRLLKDI